MFDSSYLFKFRINQKPGIGEEFETCLVYWFENSSGVRYVVNLEQYFGDLFALKFHRYKDLKSKKKFTVVTGEGRPQQILRTCLNILIEHHKSNPFASYIIFGIAGENEERTLTRRFRIYKRILENMISPVEFEHRIAEMYSAYLLLNRNYSNKQELLKIIDQKLPGINLEGIEFD
jgi:hypothetical protein